MKFKLSLLFFLTSLSLKALGQEAFKNIVGKTFVSRTSEYLKILNDTTLYSSINHYTDTAQFCIKNDTLFIEQHYWMTDRTGTKSVFKLYDYKILYFSDDSLRFKNTYRYSYKPDTWEDTLVFINLENIKESTADFNYLKLKISSPWTGNRQINIYNDGKVYFLSKPITYSMNRPDVDSSAKPKTIYGQLAQAEFENFKDILSKAMVSKLPLERGCPLDGTVSIFEIMIGNKVYKSSGCDLNRTQGLLLSYLYDIDENKGLQKFKN